MHLVLLDWEFIYLLKKIYNNMIICKEETNDPFGHVFKNLFLFFIFNLKTIFKNKFRKT